MNKISFKNSSPVFCKTLKEKVNTYFDEKQLSNVGGHKLFFKGCLLALSAMGTYITLVFFTLGGSNFQVEHHLFPGISHIHYRHLNKLLKETCKEFNITYLEHKAMAGAFYSHIVHIKKLGAV